MVIWAIISFLAIVLISFILFFVKDDKKDRKPVAEIALVFVLTGIVIGENSRWGGYLLMLIGIIIAIVDVITKEKGGKTKHGKKR